MPKNKTKPENIQGLTLASLGSSLTCVWTAPAELLVEGDSSTTNLAGDSNLEEHQKCTKKVTYFLVSRL